MRVFLDANVLVSVLNKEYPVYIYSARVLSLADHSGFQLFTSPTCLAIAYYFSEKKSGAAAKRKIHLLSSKIDITPMDKNTVLDIFKNKAIRDFEDGLEYYAALNTKCECIITEDLDDFYFSKIEVLNAKSFLAKYFL